MYNTNNETGKPLQKRGEKMKYSLKAIRTQEQAAKEIGISVETLANYERGITYPDIPVLKKIEEHYEINYNDIDFFCNELTVKPSN